jgi:hypothetical protein
LDDAFSPATPDEAVLFELAVTKTWLRPHGSPHLSFVMDEEIEPGGRHRFGGKA